jgi:hypothetical protein
MAATQTTYLGFIVTIRAAHSSWVGTNIKYHVITSTHTETFHTKSSDIIKIFTHSKFHALRCKG